MSIEVRNITKKFNGLAAVDNVTFTIETGELVAILGPSGSGKSTLLRIIAGLEIPDSGEIRLTGKETTFASPQERNVGFVFQHYALFKHMTVFENIAFGLKVRKESKSEIIRRVSELLDLVQLGGFDKRYPSQLSGGQRQRVAVARALAARPRVLLLDEPFSALDAKVSEELRQWIQRLHEHTQVTTLFVTHDQHEALEIAHKILVMNRGRIEQEGTLMDIFEHPRTPFVAEFVGENNYIDAEVTAVHEVQWGPLNFSVNGHPIGQPMRIYFRPNDVYVSSYALQQHVKATITKTRFKGATIELLLHLGDGKQIVAHVPKGVSLSSGFTVGAEVFAGITAYHAFPKTIQ
jgi:sulfate/thiosulfate transport system ATP-binding protein